ncbi:hypothetical protein [Natrinema sp. HArc-T2]|uniref:DUF7289 family protein n=1 Tax=Natrinema sp. HArc-T2 TaxID=3242701 RepID=UPI00359EDB9B
MGGARAGIDPTPNGDERGVSDVLAFMLVFAMILGSVILMSTTGMMAMQGYQEGEQSHNAQRAMQSLAANFDDVLRYDGVTERYGELSLRGGTITTDNSGTMVNITVNGTSLNGSHDLGTFTYETESGVIAYEGGGLIRATESGNSVFLEEPALTCNSDTALVSLVKINSESRSIQSDGTLGVTITRTERNRTVYDVDNVTVNVDNLTTKYDQAWNSIGEDGDGEWTCDADQVAVTVVTVDIDY